MSTPGYPLRMGVPYYYPQRVQHRDGRLGNARAYDGSERAESLWVEWDDGGSNWYLATELSNQGESR